jgi:hypothetical protein
MSASGTNQAEALGLMCSRSAAVANQSLTALKYGTYLSANAFSIGAPFLHIEAAYASIGVHNEYFLHHRSRSRNNLRCWLFRTARLIKTIVSILVTNGDHNVRQRNVI